MTPTPDHSFDIHPALADRWSPRAYSHSHVLTKEDLGPCFEAARWSASSGNSQPWSFALGLRGDDTFATILESLAEGNAVWAQHASALVANIAQLTTAEGKSHRHAVYDLGQSVAHFSVQATVEGLVVHQMGGFDADQLGTSLQLDQSHAVISVMTVGVIGDPAELPEKLREREALPRMRKPLSDVVTHGVRY